ncbi:Sensory box histidine kinase/response regulator [Pseudomonas savastanoi pv. glycinea]|uniref:ATP-binding protein n=1 Tax=Pseudomonas quasicaspiana TaxID=2829821 RepID=UPI000EFFB7D1|nr:ATP-binding protein [Pseudomonas quasicaspiana]MCD5973786.1 PAS domain S-box protein [Pseudomonas quasicaspiana]RMQ95164.1 Sensory box histidine kinase/response regulator [Pseudomonas savastanoi pv. glycinea]
MSRWSDLPLRGKALIAIALPLVILLSSLVLIYLAERQTARAEEDVRRVLLVQGDIQTVHTLLAEAAASERGYLLTHREDFLPAYNSARPLIDAALQRLDANVRDPEIRDRLQLITPLINLKLGALAKLREGNGKDPALVTDILVSNKQVLDTLREQISAMRNREATLLAERTAAAAETRERLVFATFLAACCGVFAAVAAMLLLSRGIVSRVEHVKRNAQLLAAGHPLMPQPAEKDEIGQLGTRLVEAAHLLAQREGALRENEERLRLIIDAVKDYGIFALDANGRVTTWNVGAERIKGYSEQEIIGQPFSVFYLPEQCPQRPEMALREARNKGYFMEEAWRRRKDGSRFWASVVISAQYDASGTLRGFSKVTRDISDRHAAEIALSAAREEAERASRAKSEFLSRMSHELRTPLNAILGFAQLLEIDPLPTQRQQIGHILKAGQHLLTLINEVLDIARIESGHLPVNLERIALGSVLHEALALVAPMASEARIRIAPLPVIRPEEGVIADRQRLMQVLLNLLSNAIKYNRTEGEVTLQVARSGQQLSVTVSDTGPGIAKDQLHKLFRPFERLNADHQVEGTGLGLALSKNLLEMMDGSLEVLSATDEGCSFILSLPHAVIQPETAVVASQTSTVIDTPEPTSAPYRASVLCIEDNLASLTLIETLLQRRSGIQLFSSMQGQMGLDLATRHAPDLILLDINLPDISGIKILRRLRRAVQTANIPILMMTADATPMTHKVLREAGATAILVKPINVRMFYDQIDQFLTEPV